MQTNPTPDLKGDKWPDFYAILDAKSELDDKELRRVVSDCYQQASSKMDHRDLSVRFYNQVLTQKVLPACRRILLDPAMRALYDEQLHLHREADPRAISYQEFVIEITRTKTSCLLNEDELAILPSVGSQIVDNPLSVLKPLAQKSRHVETETLMVRVKPPNELALLTAAPAKKKLPLAALGGVGALLLLGVGALVVPRLAGHQNAATATGAMTSADVPGAPKSPRAPLVPLMTINTLLKNADFENRTMEPWVMDGSGPGSKAKVKDDKNPKSGNRVLNFWSPKDHRKDRVFQNVTDLKPGKYTLKAWVKRSGSQREAYMFANQYGGPTIKVDLPRAGKEVWQQVVLTDIPVSTGKCTVGFYVSNLSGNPVNVDVVEFFAQ